MDRTFEVDRQTWKNTLQAITEAAARVPREGRRCAYPDELIVAMHLWSAWHNLNQIQACQRHHYGALFRPRKLPSRSQFNRRLKTPRCQAILQTIHHLQAPPPAEAGIFDGKPLLVSPVSKDPDAKRGHICGGFAKGYKLHVYVTPDRRILIWSVMGLNVAEQSVALAMVEHLPVLPVLSLGDGNYDSAPLHKALNARGGALLTPLKGQERVKNGRHHPVTLRQMGPGRREAVAVATAHPDLTRYVLKDRVEVENILSVLTVALDLRLPPWVRRIERVRRWIGAKIILYHARLQAQEQAKT